MSAVDLVTYQPLVDALKIPLPDNVSQREALRQAIAFAESYGVVVSEHRRKLLVELENQTAQKQSQLRDGWAWNEEGEYVRTEDQATAYAKLNADEKKVLLNAEVSGVKAELEFVTQLEELIKRRCSIGQSISNSFNLETQSSFNK